MYTASHTPKVLIIEGPDNVGKDSLIEKLHSFYNNIKVIHAEVPKSKDLFSFYYNGLIHDTLSGYYDESLDMVIHNRSMYGEYVYGPKYRNESKDNIADLIHKLELGQLRTFIFSRDLYFILLTSSNIDLLVNNDDGKSLSNKWSDIQDEVNSFNDIFNLSKIENKKKIYVNNGNTFRDKNDIYNEVLSFITNK